MQALGAGAGGQPVLWAFCSVTLGVSHPLCARPQSLSLGTLALHAGSNGGACNALGTVLGRVGALGGAVIKTCVKKRLEKKRENKKAFRHLRREVF